MMWLSSPALAVLTLLAPLPSFPAAAAAAAAPSWSLPPVHERLVPYAKAPQAVNRTQQDYDEATKARARANGKPLRVSNRCRETIHPGISTQTGVGPEEHGFELLPGASRTLMVEAHWQGRVWGRTNCSFNANGTGASNRGGYDGSGKACMTGDCNGLSDCRVSGTTPVTLAEFTYDSPGGQAFYDISLVDGYNLPVAIVLLANEAAAAADSADVNDIRLLSEIPPNLTNPVCIGTASQLASPDYNPYTAATTDNAQDDTDDDGDDSDGEERKTLAGTHLGTNASFPLRFERKQTAERLARWCPWDLQLARPTGDDDDDGDNDGEVVYTYPDTEVRRSNGFGACYSACAKSHRASDCCTGSFNSPASCRPSVYSRSAKAVCPDAYSYAYDDQKSTFIVPAGAGFEVVFCPGGRSTDILATQSEQVRRFAQLRNLRRLQRSTSQRHVRSADVATEKKEKKKVVVKRSHEGASSASSAAAATTIITAATVTSTTTSTTTNTSTVVPAAYDAAADASDNTSMMPVTTTITSTSVLASNATPLPPYPVAANYSRSTIPMSPSASTANVAAGGAGSAGGSAGVAGSASTALPLSSNSTPGIKGGAMVSPAAQSSVLAFVVAFSFVIGF